MEAINLILKTISMALFIWAALATSYMFFYSIFGLLFVEKRKKVELEDLTSPRIAVVIPAYKEDAVIIKTAESALRQLYPIGKFQVIVVADSLERSTLFKLNHLPLKVLEVNFENSTKAKSLNAVLNYLPPNFDMVVILDADNIIRPEFLTKMAEAFVNGHKAIQGHRTAKNFNTPYSLLDAISEEINNHIFCKGQQYLGMSSRLTGSGMGFDFKLFKKLMSEINAVGGFDKELELKLISSDVKIHYEPTALVYDEKVSRVDVMTKQRSRWISSQFHYLKKYLPMGLVYLFKKRDFDYFNKTFQLAIPPRILMVALLFLGCLSSFTLSNHNLFYSWFILTCVYFSVFIISFPKKFVSRHLITLFVAIPSAFLRLFSSIPFMLNANKKFIHTPHES
jgi:cellulose synthase/poly-beta-1,6-N-acetylglucosamine synthase-like glycosyltransferase